MTLSEMIAHLEALKEKYGDREVYIEWPADSAPLEVIYAETNPVDEVISLRMFDY